MHQRKFLVRLPNNCRNLPCNLNEILDLPLKQPQLLLNLPILAELTPSVLPARKPCINILSDAQYRTGDSLEAFQRCALLTELPLAERKVILLIKQKILQLQAQSNPSMLDQL